MNTIAKVLTGVLLVSVFFIGLGGGYFGAYFMSGKETQVADEEIRAQKSDEIDFTDIVVDAFSRDVEHQYGDYNYRIPKIDSDREGVEEFNKKMYDELYALYTESEEDAVHLGGEPGLSEISYTWYHTDDVISIVVMTNSTMMYYPEYYVYSFSFSKARELTKADIIELEGYDRDIFMVKVREAVESVTDFVLENTENADRSMFEEAISDTFSDEHTDKAVPFYNNDGELCAVADVFALGGAGMYKHLINLETRTDICIFDCGNKF